MNSNEKEEYDGSEGVWRWTQNENITKCPENHM